MHPKVLLAVATLMTKRSTGEEPPGCPTFRDPSLIPAAKSTSGCSQQIGYEQRGHHWSLPFVRIRDSPICG